MVAVIGGCKIAGNCWFIAAVACLAISPEQLLHRVVPFSQHFQQDYAGDPISCLKFEPLYK